MKIIIRKYPFVTIILILIFANTCKKETSVRDLLTSTKWQVTSYCGSPVSDYKWTFKPDGTFIQESINSNSYSSWSLKDNDKILVIGSSEKTIISLTETELTLREPGGLFMCSWTFTAVPL